MNRFEERKETIFDHETNLEWEKEHSGPMTWAEAVKYAEKIGNGWRLPTINELTTLIDYERFDPESAFPGMPSIRFWSSTSYAGHFWSSTSYAGSASFAWYVNFFNGRVNYYGKTNTYYVRCVRSVDGGSE